MRTALPTLALVLAGTAAAFAQTPPPPPPPTPLSQGDMSVTLGWFSANKSGLDPENYNDWYNRSVHGGLTAGWYWTDHHKTEVEFGVTNTATLHTYPRFLVDGFYTTVVTGYSFRTRKLAVGHHYQFGRNAWVHPFVAAGVEATWERITEEQGPTFVYDPATRRQIETRPPRVVPPRTELTARPYAAGGIKVYMTRRSFFRTDLRAGFRGGVDDVLVRFGFGMDF